MVQYICSRCDKIFDKKSNYEMHINRKFKCKEIERPVIPQQPDPNTILINTLIEENNTIKTELQQLKANADKEKANTAKKTDELKTLYSREIDSLKKMLMELQRTSQINSNNNVNIGNTTNNNTINIISFNNDHNMSQILLKDEIIKLLKSNDCVKEAIQLCYYNDRIPQYKNIDVKANEGEYECKVHDGEKFVDIDWINFTSKLINKSCDVATDSIAINDLQPENEKVPKSKTRRVKDRIDTYKSYINATDPVSEDYEPELSEMTISLLKDVLKTTIKT